MRLPLALAGLLLTACGSLPKFSSSDVVLTTFADGPGTISVTPRPPACASCAAGEAHFPAGTAVVLSAAAAAGASFDGWAGACSGTAPCPLRLDESHAVIAKFSRDLEAVGVALAGSGHGRVTSAPAGIDCGASCAAQFPAGAALTLTATADDGSTFLGWSDPCGTAAICALTPGAATSLTARFGRIQHALTVSTAGSGLGSVLSSPAGIACGSNCSAQFDAGAGVVLAPMAATGSVFAGWTGNCAGVGLCLLTLDADRSAVATFSPAPSNGGGSGVPALFSVSPPSVPAGATSVTLTLRGFDLLGSSQVFLNGAPRTAQFVDANTLTVALPDADLALGAIYQIVVGNPPPGGGLSGAQTLSVTNPAPWRAASLPRRRRSAPPPSRWR